MLSHSFFRSEVWVKREQFNQVLFLLRQKTAIKMSAVLCSHLWPEWRIVNLFRLSAEFILFGCRIEDLSLLLAVGWRSLSDSRDHLATSLPAGLPAWPLETHGLWCGSASKTQFYKCSINTFALFYYIEATDRFCQHSREGSRRWRSRDHPRVCSSYSLTCVLIETKETYI